MSRQILCAKCDQDRSAQYPSGMYPEDRAMGFQCRRVVLEVRKPERHGVSVNGVFEPLHAIYCDLCGEKIPDGQKAAAISLWRGGGMGEWESEFGKVVP